MKFNLKIIGKISDEKGVDVKDYLGVSFFEALALIVAYPRKRYETVWYNLSNQEEDV